MQYFFFAGMKNAQRPCERIWTFKITVYFHIATAIERVVKF